MYELFYHFVFVKKTITDTSSTTSKDVHGPIHKLEYHIQMNSTVFDMVTVTSKTESPFRITHSKSSKLCISDHRQIPFKNPKIKQGVTGHPYHIGGAKLAPNLHISRLKLKVHLKNTTQLEFHQTLHRLSLTGRRRYRLRQSGISVCELHL